MNKDEYIRLSLEQNRKIQLMILDKLHYYCKQQELRYFLIAGTLLGAVRHRGYIPWDDDIDVVMLRDDYNKLIEDFEDDDYFLASNKTINCYPFPFAKLCLNHSCVIEESKILKQPLGINIDIFPIDRLPDEKRKRNRIFKKIKFCRWILDIKDTKFSNKRKISKNIILGLLQLICLPVSCKQVIAVINKEAQKYSLVNSSKCAEIVWGCGEREVVQISAFEKSVELEFENRMYFAPIGWDEWLTSRYGNYMQLPSKDKQISHHSIVAYIKSNKLKEYLK